MLPAMLLCGVRTFLPDCSARTHMYDCPIKIASAGPAGKGKRGDLGLGKAFQWV